MVGQPFSLSTHLSLNPEPELPAATSHSELHLTVSHFVYILLAATFSQGKRDSVAWENCLSASRADVQTLAVSQVTIHSESHVHTVCPRAVAQL